MLFRSELPVSPPRLRLTELAATSPGDPAALSAGGRRAERPPLRPETPLAEVPGIGPRTASRLAGLGLLLVGDLIRHYPRDYLDYANLVRIAGLQPGSTATVVATVRRCHAFASPRNPNLAILELHLQDCTGRLRVSRFTAGRRFTTPGWLHSQQRLFPAGATVAVSGLVKPSPYGPMFSDPLLEVLESPGASMRSESIGRLVPVYALTEGLSADTLRQAIRALLPHLSGWGDPLPEVIRQEQEIGRAHV